MQSEGILRIITEHLVNTLTTNKNKPGKSGKSPDIRNATTHRHWSYPKGFSPTGRGTGIDTFVVVDVDSLLCGQPMSGTLLFDETDHQATHSKKKEKTLQRE